MRQTNNRQDLGFTARVEPGGISIFHRGRKATTLRGSKAVEFEHALAQGSPAELQQLMARLTGNFKRGNERVARNHPRNLKR